MRMSYAKYKFADLTIFIALALLFSFISEYAYLKINNPLVYLNFGLLISAIAIVRWGFWGSLAYAFSGIPLLIFRSGEAELWFQILYYVFANMTIGISVLLFKFLGKDKIHKSFFHALLFLGVIFISVTIVKGVLLSFLAGDLFGQIYSYFLAESFNMVITVLAFVFINRFSDGLIVDMKSYIISVQREKSEHD